MSKKRTVPRWPSLLLRWFCKPSLYEDVQGDIAELYQRRLGQSALFARWAYMLDVLMLFRPGIIKSVHNPNLIINYSMLENYLKIARRNALRHKGFTLLNTLGLVVGITSSLLILLWMQDELQVDQFHDKGDQIYQVLRNMRQSNGVITTTKSIPKPVGDLVNAEYSEVGEVSYLSWPMNSLLTYEDKRIQSDGRFASPEFLETFSFPLLLGDKGSALSELNTMVISKDLAHMLFGDRWAELALGSSLQIENRFTAIITGVLEDVPAASTIRFDWLISASTFFTQNNWVNNWGNGSFRIFLTIPDPSAVPIVQKRLHSEIVAHTKDNAGAGEETLMLQKFNTTYLHSAIDNGEIAGGRIDYVRIMGVVSTFLLLIACINFMNLATARSGRRSKEVGLRKVMGSQKRSIGLQFLFESLIVSSIATILSLLLVWVVLPSFNQLVDKSLSLDFSNVYLWLFLVSVTLLVGLLSGSYPAFLLPRFPIIDALKGKVRQSSGAAYFRQSLVVFQFAMSTLLIIGTAVILKQLNYVLKKDLGMDTENLVAVWMEGDLGAKFETYKAELHSIPEVEAVSVTSGNPVSYGRSTSSASWEGKDPSKGYEINILLTDTDFTNTMRMEMSQGRTFSDQLKDSTNFLINETAAELMGFEDPINKKLSFWGIDGQIVGVVKNFHMQSMYEPIAPLIITCISPNRSEAAMVRLKGDISKGLEAVERVTKSLNPAYDFDYEFVDLTYAESYEDEARISRLVKIFAGISIFISSLGLLALSAFSAEQRSKEIGVRKVHGASTFQLVILLSKDYSKLILTAFAVAVPVGVYFSARWLDGFEYRTHLGPQVFIISGILTFAIGALTVSFKSFQAAKANPCNTLKDE